LWRNGRHLAARASPDACCSTLPLHKLCLFKKGIRLGELWHLTLLADRLRAHGL